MTLRTFLIKATTANLLFAWVPVIGCVLVGVIQRFRMAWEVLSCFPRIWATALAVSAVVTFVLSSISFYRRDFLVGLFALSGSFLVFFAFVTKLYFGGESCGSWR